MIDRITAKQILDIYGQAWVEQDPNLIVQIFTKDASYQEWAFNKPFIGHDEIKSYWQSKVVEEQSEIEFNVLNYYIDGDIIIAEWEAKFLIKGDGIRNHMIEVAILEIENGKIKSLKEYWANQFLNITSP